MNKKEENIGNIETAFLMIKSILLQKDNRINELEEENILLKSKIKELESSIISSNKQNENNNDQELFKNEYFSERENSLNINNIKNSSLNPYNLNYNYSSESTVKQNSYKEAVNSVTDSPFKTIKKVLSPISVQNTYSSNYAISETNYNNYNIEKNHVGPLIGKSQTADTSRNEVKFFLNEVKEKIPVKDFKEFIKYIKILTDKSQNSLNRKEIFDNVKLLFGTKYKDLYQKFEMLLSVKK